MFSFRKNKLIALMNYFELSSKDQDYLISKYGYKKIDKWVIERYLLDKGKEKHYKELFNQLLEERYKFYKEFLNMDLRKYLHYQFTSYGALEIISKLGIHKIDLFILETVFKNDSLSVLEGTGINKVVLSLPHQDIEIMFIKKIREYVDKKPSNEMVKEFMTILGKENFIHGFNP